MGPCGSPPHEPAYLGLAAVAKWAAEQTPVRVLNGRLDDEDVMDAQLIQETLRTGYASERAGFRGEAGLHSAHAVRVGSVRAPDELSEEGGDVVMI